MKQQEAWNNEYTNSQGVPTSTRTTPSLAVKKLLDYFNSNGITTGKRVIDLGCGMGRNTRYLAERGFQVTAVDFAQSALGKLEESINGEVYAGNITIRQCSLADTLPFVDSSFDFAIDIVTTMTLMPDELKGFSNELKRILVPDGYYLTYVLADDDGYLQAASAQDKRVTVADSGITDHYLSEDDLRNTYSGWEFVHLEKIIKQDTFYGKDYTRRIWWGLLKNTK